MDAGVKLKELLPMFRSVFPPEDVNALVDELTKKNILKWEETKTSYDTIDKVVSIIPSLGQEAILAFINAIQRIGERSLYILTEKFLSKKTDDLTSWLIINWEQVISCSSALEGLDDYVTGISADDHITANQWVEIIYEISCANPESVKYFVLQIIQNVFFSKKSEIDVSSAFDCLLKVFKPIMESALNDDGFITIANHLENSGVLAKESDAETLRCNEKPFNILVDLIAKNPTMECLQVCARAIRDQDLHYLAFILVRFFKQTNRKLLWLLVHWSKLYENSIYMFDSAKQHMYTTQQVLPQGNMWIGELMLRVAIEDSLRVDMLMKDLKGMVSIVKIVMRPQGVRTKSAANKEVAEKRDAPYALRSKDTHSDTPKTQQSTTDIASGSYGSHSKDKSGFDSQTQHGGSTTNIVSAASDSKSRPKSKENDFDDSISDNVVLNSELSSSQENMEVAEEGNGNSASSCIVEFHLLIDKNCRMLQNANNGSMRVFLVQTDENLPLTYYPERDVFYGHCVLNLSHATLVYKYVWIDAYRKENWESVPYGFGNVNREVSVEQVIDDNSIRLYDVANFDARENRSLHKFTSMYSRNFNRYLPNIAHMQLGKEKELPMNFNSCLRGLKDWWKFANIGVNFDSSDGEFASLLASCRSELQLYVKKYAAYGNKTTSFEVCQRVLTNLAVLLLIMKNEIKFVGDNKRAAHAYLCFALCPVCSNEADTKVLYQEVANSESDMVQEVCRAILYLKEQTNDPLFSLLLLPLYYIFTNNGSSTYKEKVWMEAVEKLGLEKNLIKTEKFYQVLPMVVNVSRLFPAMTDVFQSMLSMSAMLHLLNGNQDVVKVLKPSLFLVTLLEYMKMEKFEQFFGSKKLCGWIETYLDEVTKQCQSRASEQNHFSVIGEMNGALNNFLKKKKNLSEKGSAAVFAFFRIAVKVQTCYSHLLEYQSNSCEMLGKTVEALLQHIQEFIAAETSAHVTAVLIKMWNFFLAGQITDSEMNMIWKSGISKAIRDSLLGKLNCTNSNVLRAFEVDLDGWKPSTEVQGCFSEAVFTYAMSLKYKKGSNYVTRLWYNRESGNVQLARLILVFHRMLMESWQKWKAKTPNDYTSTVLNFALSSPFVAYFLRLFGGFAADDEKKNLVKDDVQKKMKDILTKLSAVESNLQSGQIRFRHINIILDSKMNFEEVLALIHTRKEAESSEMLIQREKEMLAYRRMREAVQYLVHFLGNSGG